MSQDILNNYFKKQELIKKESRDYLFRSLKNIKDFDYIDISFNGSGDNGQIEDILYYKDNEIIKYENDELKEQIENFVYANLPSGWEINDGAYGNIHITIDPINATFEYNERYTDTTYSEYKII